MKSSSVASGALMAFSKAAMSGVGCQVWLGGWKVRGISSPASLTKSVSKSGSSCSASPPPAGFFCGVGSLGLFQPAILISVAVVTR